jgi:hypothetical protein
VAGWRVGKGTGAGPDVVVRGGACGTRYGTDCGIAAIALAHRCRPSAMRSPSNLARRYFVRLLGRYGGAWWGGGDVHYVFRPPWRWWSESFSAFQGMSWVYAYRVITSSLALPSCAEGGCEVLHILYGNRDLGVGGRCRRRVSVTV